MIHFNSLITTYNNIIFDNYLELLITTESQFANINITVILSLIIPIILLKL